MRTVTVIGTTVSGPREYTTEATTWGQLRDVISREFGNVEGMKAVVKETRGNLERNDAVLPEEDFTLFLTPGKIKAGTVDVVQMLGALKEEFNTAIDEVIDRIQAGEFDVDDEENAPVKSHVKGISREDAEFLASLQNEG